MVHVLHVAADEPDFAILDPIEGFLRNVDTCDVVRKMLDKRNVVARPDGSNEHRGVGRSFGQERLFEAFDHFRFGRPKVIGLPRVREEQPRIQDMVAMPAGIRIPGLLARKFVVVEFHSLFSQAAFFS